MKLSAQARAVLGFVVILAVWVVVDALRLVSPLLLPPPGVVATAFVQGIYDGSLIRDAAATSWRSIAGLGIACASGIPAGLALSLSPSVRQSGEPVLDFFRTIPATAMMPLFMVIFGIGDATRIFLVGFSGGLVMAAGTAAGLRSVSPTRIAAARVMGATPFQILRHITIMDALPQVYLSVRICASLSLIVVVVTEMLIGSVNGIGRRIYDAQLVFNGSQMFVGILAAGGVGALLNAALGFAGNRLLHWVGRT